MVSDVIVLWMAALPLMGSPGPATLSLAAIGAAFGVRAGLTYLLGVVAGTCVVLILIATGITGLILAAPTAVLFIQVIAAAYILYLAFRIATAPVLGDHRRDAKPPAFHLGFGLAIANPKAYVAIGAVYSGHTLLANNWALDAIGKIGALSLVIVAVNVAWLAFGSALSRLLRHPTWGRAANVAFALMLVASVALALMPR